MIDETPDRFGRYLIDSELGRGAMGVVYRALDPVLDRTVAVKTIALSADPEERERSEARFYQEAKAAGGLNHPAIITIHDVGREGGMVWMAMELLEGTELRHLLANERMGVERALDIVGQVADALGYAHERGVVHRDIKPANIMILRGGQVKIMDFGIARLWISDVKTQTGMLLGSPKYMSPEQAMGSGVDQRSDIFSLGVVLYEMLTGNPPFAGKDVTQLLYNVSTVMPPPPSTINRAVPEMVDLVIAKALAKNPADRYQSAAEMQADLLACRYEVAQQAASDDATVRLDAATPGADGSRTLSGGSTLVGTDAAVRLPVSRRFDAGVALAYLEHLAERSGVDDGSATLAARAATLARTTRKRIDRVQRKTDALMLTGVVAVACVIAFLIVYL
ncbi:MAG: serine/threonine protein kinase [Burkholderiales bacterium]|nr:serine/threonine protein kinase [Burkholderiales bacterium]